VNLLPVEELKTLVEQAQGICVSLYIPMSRLQLEKKIQFGSGIEALLRGSY
jgi:hypothetical protein